MSSPISNALSIASGAVANSSQISAARPTQQTTQQTTIAPDTVRLSETQQVYQLYNQGQEVTQIASYLNISVSDVIPTWA